MTRLDYLRDRLAGISPASPDVRVFDRADQRLGRHQVHDPRARLHDARKTVRYDPLPQAHVHHPRRGPVFEQGDLGMCTAVAALGVLMTGPFWQPGVHGTPPQAVALHGVRGVTPFTEADGMQLYREETRLDDTVFPGHWEPEDTGSTGDWSMAALRARGLISGWVHAFRWQDVVRLVAKGPVSVGVPWYDSMFEPRPDGTVELAGHVMGGHQFVVDELIPVSDRSGRGQVADYVLGATNSWGTSYGLDGRFFMPGPVWKRLLAEGGDVCTAVL